MLRIYLLSLCILKVFAWGALGHMLTARIAEIKLNNNTAY